MRHKEYRARCASMTSAECAAELDACSNSEWNSGNDSRIMILAHRMDELRTQEANALRARVAALEAKLDQLWQAGVHR